MIRRFGALSRQAYTVRACSVKPTSHAKIKLPGFLLDHLLGLAFTGRLNRISYASGRILASGKPLAKAYNLGQNSGINLYSVPGFLVPLRGKE